MAESSNFAVLKERDPVFFPLARTAERVFASDANATPIKLRQLGETLDGIKVARALAIGYQQSFGKDGSAFKPGPLHYSRRPQRPAARADRAVARRAGRQPPAAGEQPAEGRAARPGA
ncbi:hypothetical protein KRX52_14870 [Pseudomonas sp. MAP12]|uniref:Uncharacterized protein n=1 Tax=Geopseudomonas aromaticivorans TaxID=2849492 RepID=A0ABS6MZ20_9GAMM|nr:hypothetical protein [Pseudomonas aromaticivorans]MBV2134061.1 hypothetical protein [Pseudomonas aromaticivorans]